MEGERGVIMTFPPLGTTPLGLMIPGMEVFRGSTSLPDVGLEELVILESVRLAGMLLHTWTITTPGVLTWEKEGDALVDTVVEFLDKFGRILRYPGIGLVVGGTNADFASVSSGELLPEELLLSEERAFLILICTLEVNFSIVVASILESESLPMEVTLLLAGALEATVSKLEVGMLELEDSALTVHTLEADDEIEVDSKSKPDIASPLSSVTLPVFSETTRSVDSKESDCVLVERRGLVFSSSWSSDPCVPTVASFGETAKFWSLTFAALESVLSVVTITSEALLVKV